MKQNELVLISIAMLLGLVIVSVAAAPSDYSPDVIPNSSGNTFVTWEIKSSPDVPFSLFWTGSEYWHAEEGSLVTLNITSIDNEVHGILALGNATLNSTNTNIAKDLALGVWGSTEWWPGLVVKVGSTNIVELNATAYASAERVHLNYLNGTMISDYQSLTVNNDTYSCIVFEYEQDPTGFGESQKTMLAYDLDTGILVKANTSYSFGVPYILEFELVDIAIPASTTTSQTSTDTTPSLTEFPFILYSMLALAGFGVVVIVIVVLKKR